MGPAVPEVGPQPQKGPDGRRLGSRRGHRLRVIRTPTVAMSTVQRGLQLAQVHGHRVDAAIGGQRGLGHRAASASRRSNDRDRRTRFRRRCRRPRRSRRCRPTVAPGRRRARSMARSRSISKGWARSFSSGSTPWTPKARSPRSWIRSPPGLRRRRPRHAGHRAPDAPAGHPPAVGRQRSRAGTEAGDELAGEGHQLTSGSGPSDGRSCARAR